MGIWTADIGNDPYDDYNLIIEVLWTGTAAPFSWLDLNPSVNMSIGGQANRYPIGYKPTEFRYRDR